MPASGISRPASIAPLTESTPGRHPSIAAGQHVGFQRPDPSDGIAARPTSSAASHGTVPLIRVSCRSIAPSQLPIGTLDSPAESLRGRHAGSSPGRRSGPLSRITRRAGVSRIGFQAEANRVNVSTPGRSKQQPGFPYTSTACARAATASQEIRSKDKLARTRTGHPCPALLQRTPGRLNSMDKTPVVNSSTVYSAQYPLPACPLACPLGTYLTGTREKRKRAATVGSFSPAHSASTLLRRSLVLPSSGLGIHLKEHFCNPD